MNRLSQKQIQLPRAKYLGDIDNATSDHEVFAYVILASRHYGVSINTDLNYLDMAIDIKNRMDHLPVDDEKRVSDHYCMFCVISAALDVCNRLHEGTYAA